MKYRNTISIAFSLCIGIMALLSFNSAALAQQRAQADLKIKQFLFPHGNDKALRIHVANTGKATSGACRLILTLRKINGVSVGRKTHTNVPALAGGADVWLVIDAKSILPNNVSLQSTTFKLNIDGTKIIAESDESNNEVWHGLSATAAIGQAIGGFANDGDEADASKPEASDTQRLSAQAPTQRRKPAATQNVAASPQPTFDRKAFEDSLHAAVAPKVMGYTFLLIKDGRVAAEGAGGLARNAADGKMTMTTNTPQNLGSLFKFITGVTVLHMLDRAPAGSAGGNNSFETRLNAPVALLYPQLWQSAIKTPAIRSITFRELLQHKSGFRDCSKPLSCFGGSYNAALRGQRSYENFNFSLSGYLIALYTNPDLIGTLNNVPDSMPFEDRESNMQVVLGDRMDRFMRQKMFPLAPGKISASCDAEDEYKATGAYGYVSKFDRGKGIITSRRNGGKPCSGAGGYWMSIRDFGAFVAAALHSDLMLSQKARLEMFRTGMPADDRLVWSFTTTDQWIADKFKMSTIIWSNGIQPYPDTGGQSFNTVLLRLPLNYELMVFANSGGMNVNSLKDAGLKAFRAGIR